MNIRELTGPLPARPDPGSVLVVDIGRREVTATNWIVNLESEVLARAEAIQSVDNAQEQAMAVEAQTSLARYIRVVQNAEGAAKKPLNDVRGKILDLSKQMQAKVDAEGNRIGALVAEFQIAENNRVAAARRLQDVKAHELERKRDTELLKCRTLEQQQAVKEDFTEQIAATATQVEPVKAQSQVVREDWTVQVVDIWLLARAMPSCVTIEPRLSEIKSLLNAGVKVPGVLAEKVIKSTVRIGREQNAINI